MKLIVQRILNFDLSKLPYLACLLNDFVAYSKLRVMNVLVMADKVKPTRI